MGRTRRAPPTDQNFFNFIGFFRKYYQNIGQASPTLGVGGYLNRHCFFVREMVTFDIFCHKNGTGADR